MLILCCDSFKVCCYARFDFLECFRVLRVLGMIFVIVTLWNSGVLIIGFGIVRLWGV